MADGEQGSPYRACTLIMPDGKVGRGKSVKAIRLMTVDQAAAALAGGKAAWVAPDDEERVLERLKLAGMV